MADKFIDVVVSSPFKRAVDTVSHFAEEYGHEIVLVEDFKERKVDNCWIENFQDFTRRQWEDFDYKLTDGETLREVQTRNISALKLILQEYRDKNIVVGSHGTALSTIINYYKPIFGYADFDRIRALMPWVVEFTFDEDECLGIREVNLFEVE